MQLLHNTNTITPLNSTVNSNQLGSTQLLWESTFRRQICCRIKIRLITFFIHKSINWPDGRSLFRSDEMMWDFTPVIFYKRYDDIPTFTCVCIGIDRSLLQQLINYILSIKKLWYLGFAGSMVLAVLSIKKLWYSGFVNSILIVILSIKNYDTWVLSVLWYLQFCQ